MKKQGKLSQAKEKPAFETWKTLEKSFTVSHKRRCMEIKKKLNSLKYNEEQDINIFIATMQNLIDELENIDHDMEPSTKAGIFNRALPENLRFINVFQYKHDWNKLCEYVKNVISDIVFSNLKGLLKSEESTKQIF